MISVSQNLPSTPTQGYNLYSGNIGAVAQTFTITQSYDVTGVYFYVKKVGSPAGTMYAAIVSYTGSPGTSAIPGSTTYASSSDIDVSTLSTGYQLVYFPLTATLPAGTYMVGLEYDYTGTSNSSNCIFVGNINDNIPGQNSAFEMGSGFDVTWSGTSVTDLMYDITADGYVTHDQLGKFSVYVPSPTDSTVTSITDGGWGAQGAGAQAPAGNSRPAAATTDQTQSGVFRVYKNTLQTQTGKFRTYKITQQLQHGLFRVGKTSTQTQSGLFRVTDTPSQSQQGKFRVYRNTTQSQTGKFEVSELETYVQQGRFRVGKTTQNTQVGKFRVQSTTLRVQTGKFSIYSLLEKDISGVFRVATQVSVDISGQFTVYANQNKNQQGRFRTYNPTLNQGQYEPKRSNDGQYEDGMDIGSGIYEKKTKPDGQFTQVQQGESGIYEKKKINEGTF